MVRMSSSPKADHCPFLNRHDGRCGKFLSISGLGHAYSRCFGQYHSCPVYEDMLLERLARRGAETHGRAMTDPDDVHARAQPSIPVLQISIRGQSAARRHGYTASSVPCASAHADAA